MADQIPNPFDKSLAPKDAWSRMMFRRYGGRNDDIIAYSHQQDNLINPSSGFGSNSRIGGSNFPLGSGSVSLKLGGGNTPSNPGAYNYNTLNNTIGGAASTIKWNFDTRNKLRTNQDKQDRIKTLQDARDQKAQSAQKKQDLNTFANNTLKQAQALQAGNYASRTKTVRKGAGSPINKPPQTVNLLKGPGTFPNTHFGNQQPPQTP